MRHSKRFPLLYISITDPHRHESAPLGLAVGVALVPVGALVTLTVEHRRTGYTPLIETHSRPSKCAL